MLTSSRNSSCYESIGGVRTTTTWWSCEVLRLVARIQGTKVGTVAHPNLRRAKRRETVAETVNANASMEPS